MLSRFIYQDEARGFGIAALDCDGVEQIAKGALWGLSPGERIELHGQWIVDARYGKQFRVQTARPILPASSAGIAEYIAQAGIDGVGKALAERIVARFGAETLQIIKESPKRLREVDGVGKSRQKAIVAGLAGRLLNSEVHAYLFGLGLGATLVRRILERYGADALRTVRERPYALADDVAGVGFRTADRIARKQGLAADHPARLQAGVLHALSDLAARGHTACPWAAVLDHATKLLACEHEPVQEAMRRACDAGRCDRVHVTGGDERLVSRGLYRAETGLADDLDRLSQSFGAALSEPELAGRLQLAAIALGFGLQGMQRDAVATALASGLMVVTGGPGTGKTTIVQGLLAASGPDKEQVALCAPTGRAARRLTESTDHDASTVHRLLEYDPRLNRFTRDRENPLEATLVICDESSMLDVPLAAALCAAIPRGGRLMLVGDADQLPSVGPGSVLGDIIAASVCPIVRLDRIYRQASRSLIVQSAHQVRMGQSPTSATDADGDFFIVARDTPERIMETLLEVVCQRLPGRYGYDPIDDIQVLVPVHRGDIGTESLNAALRARLNPDGAEVGGGFRVGDKVIQVRNNYDLDVFNGDVGRVLERTGGHVQVQFGARLVDVPFESLDNLQLAYAITVHKAQGSEYPAVVVPLHSQHHMLLQRNLLYTAITRARRFAVLIGQPQAIERAVRNASPDRRATLLAPLLTGKVARTPPDAVTDGEHARH